MGQRASVPKQALPLPSHQVTKGKYTVTYPDHSARKQSALYVRSRRALCEVQDLGCWLCGQQRSHGALTETHHYFVEWAAASAVDWVKFGERARNWYHPQTGQHIGSAFNWSLVAQKPELFVDSPSNLLVLCQQHHRGRLGIHTVPFPGWVLQAAPRPGFKFLA
jgi:hypothetical protein